MPLYYIYLLPLATSAIAGLTTLRLAWPKTFRLFAVFLATTFTVEVIAFLWSYQFHHSAWWTYSSNNIWLYNLYLIPQYLFYFYFFSGTIRMPWIRKAALVLSAIYVFVAIQNLFYYRKLFVVDGNTIITANLIVIAFTMIYFIQLMRANTVIKLSRQPMFWIAAGAFIFHLGSLPCFMLYKYISIEDSVLATSLFRIIVMLNCVMYIFYSTAFLCTRKFPTPPS